ncbi:hypothetical protein HHK36_032971 [Tetracentron sinense]|uniref:Uncharacterized protein n=1 Tax=Tetracentron sinense TaxID=13715 RepID=A0A834Y443_TETSI|nr:hypothetical protein HHK36_032971 [Tetracentron sinense]
MATTVLRSQEYPKDWFPTETLTSPPLKSRRNPNPNPNSTQSSTRKRNPFGFQEKRNGRNRCRTTFVKAPGQNFVMGQVTILKRGEELKPIKDRGSEVGDDEKKAKIDTDEGFGLCSMDLLGQDREMVSKEIRLTDLNSGNGVYAGLAFFHSPPPSSLPIPSFFAKKEDGRIGVKETIEVKPSRISATSAVIRWSYA